MQRASVTNFIIVVAGGILGFIANKGVTKDQWILAVFLIIIGLFGALFTAKQYERFRFHMQAAGLYRKEIEKKFEGGICWLSPETTFIFPLSNAGNVSSNLN